MKQLESNAAIDSTLKSLYWIGGAAALLAAVIFRRNIGAEVSLFSSYAFPDTVGAWFQLLQSNRLVGLAYLNLFDVVDYSLLGLMFLALYRVLRPVAHGYMLLATVMGLVGMTVSFTTNTALSMLSLSDQYVNAPTEAHRAMYLAAGQAMLAIGRGPGEIAQSSGAYASFLLMALATLFSSLVMLQSKQFGRRCAYLGLAASGLDMIYCLAVVFVPASAVRLVGLGTLPLAGLFLMFWHFVIGWKLMRLGMGQLEVPA